MFFEDYKKTNKILKNFGGYCRKQKNKNDAVLLKLPKNLGFENEYGSCGITRITIGGDIANIKYV